MSPSRIVRTGLVWLVYVALCAAAAIVLATWIPWVACKPLSDLPDEEVEVSEIPADAHCYSIDRGELQFSRREAVAENPVPFAATGAVAALLLALAVWPRLWNGLRSWARGRRRF
jgi:hypothetical protein